MSFFHVVGIDMMIIAINPHSSRIMRTGLEVAETS